MRSLCRSLTLRLAALAVLVQGLPALQAAGAFDRKALAAGQFWRIFTCHWTHWSSEHFLWNRAIFVVLGLGCEWRNRRRFRDCVLTAAAVVPVCVYAGLPRMEAYRGLSGIDSALYLLLGSYLLDESRRDGDTVTWLTTSLLLVGFLLKVSYELLTGACVFVDLSTAGLVPVPLAHLAGALVGYNMRADAALRQTAGAGPG
jgi:rhomboid family GlyGly-CTERM serine protease